MRFKATALASFPRSGNTLLRHLLFHAAHLHSRYILNPESDPSHLAAAIPQLESPNAPLIKTHSLDASHFDSVIHLVRNPAHAIASYLDYCKAFNIPSLPRPTFIRQEAALWSRHTSFWSNLNPPLPYLRIQFQTLASNPAPTLRRISSFLQLNLSESAIASALSQCSLPALQAKGSKSFFPLGLKRNPASSLSQTELHTISILTSHAFNSLH
ncbi:sulfotransferase domain-containing protein [Thiocapsa sp. N5-Cardenillas]|uniref:sulfotransferase domain-containing protein n=1 Tax=Thiocapsa sp. N5-Cardenillas TaxID=3137397 RepID=UPI0035AE3DBB